MTQQSAPQSRYSATLERQEAKLSSVNKNVLKKNFEKKCLPPPPSPVIFLVDNGSVAAASILNLRVVAELLTTRVGVQIHAVSYLHSNRVPAEELGGVKGATLATSLNLHLQQGARSFIILPFFFALGAVFGKIMGVVEAKKASHPDLQVHYAPSLVNLEGNSPDIRVASILRKRVAQTLGSFEKTPEHPAVVLLDHGSPLPHMVHLRNYVAGQLSVLLHTNGDKVAGCVAASMERREGVEYDFGEPLLENLLARPPFNAGDVVVAMMFLSPGKHAGKDGDVEEICKRAQERSPGLRCHMTELVGTHNDVIDILEQNLRQVLPVTTKRT